MKKTKRLLAVLLSLVFMFSAAQIALAYVVADGSCGSYATWSLDNKGNLTIKGSGSIVAYNGSTNKSFRMYADKINAVVIKGSVSSITTQTFQKMNALKSVSITSKMEIIGQSAFASCPALTGVTLPEGLVMLGNKAFEGCASLSEIVLPASVQKLGDGVFLNCDALQTITVLSADAAFPTALFSPKTTAIKGYTGSTAEAYAKTFGLTFIPLDSSAPTQPSSETPTAPQTTSDAAAATGEKCPLCGEVHTGFPGSLLGFLHQGIFVILKLFGL